VALIQPGWGNKRDRHYYPRDVIERDAGVFAGVKMYESDHRDQEKSTRTWVSTVTGIKGFTADGAPIAAVSVHDRDFAERLIALDADGLLPKMECSILAAGRARKGEVGGQRGHIVEAITSAESVDWVTRAGAGGRVLALAETEHGGSMDENETPAESANTAPVEVPVQEGEPEPAVLSEQEPEQAAPPTPAPPALEAETVRGLVEATGLPDAARARLLRETYVAADDVQAAISAEIAYIKELTGSGRPFAQGGGAPSHPASLTEDQKRARFNTIMREIGAREV
jgi:hypothetical protein